MFKALELLLDGVCRQVSIHVMKLHVIGVLFWLMVYRRQAASRGRNRHLKKVGFANFGQIVNKTQWGQPLLFDAVGPYIIPRGMFRVPK